MTLTGRPPYPWWGVRGCPALTLGAWESRPQHPPRIGDGPVNVT